MQLNRFNGIAPAIDADKIGQSFSMFSIFYTFNDETFEFIIDDCLIVRWNISRASIALFFSQISIEKYD